MSMYVSLVILLITLGIISYNPSHGANQVPEISEAVVNLKIRQFCCKDGECKTTVEGDTCNGTFEILLENIYDGLRKKKMEKGDREIPITIIGKDGNPAAKDTNNLRLLRAIEGMLATQYGPTELLFKPHDSTSLKKTKQPQKIPENEEKPIDSVSYNRSSVTSKPGLNLAMSNIMDEYDEPQQIYVTQEEKTFEANYNNIEEYRRFGHNYFKLPLYKPSKKHDVVIPIGFSETEIKRIRLEVLYKANYYREIYGMKKLQLDDNMNYYSQDWANHLAEKANHLSLNSTVEHSIIDVLENDYYGENVFTSLPIKHVGEVAVDVCYYEVGSFKEIDDGDIGFYRYRKLKRLTQLLWRVTEQIGVGAAKGNDGKYYVVMNFNPRGNVVGFMNDNIPTFTDTQINEAKEKLDRINANSGTLVELLEKRNLYGVPSLPGWQTKLYDKKIQTVASVNPRH